MTRPLVPLLALGLLAGTAAAQQPGLSVGTSTALGYRQYLDVPIHCCPLWTWAEFGSGRFGLHLDYLYSYTESESRGGYPLDGNDNWERLFGKAGFDGPQERASLVWHGIRVVRRHEAGAALAWRAIRRPGYTLSVLVGVMRVSSDVYDCQAEEGPIEQVVPAPAEYTRSDPDYTVYEWRLTEGDRERCRAKKGKGWPSGFTLVGLNTGVTLDVPIGERAYFRAGFRPLFTAVVGFGVGF